MSVNQSNDIYKNGECYCQCRPRWQNCYSPYHHRHTVYK